MNFFLCCFHNVFLAWSFWSTPEAALVDPTWVGTTNDMNTNTNWNPNTVPGAGDQATFDNTSTNQTPQLLAGTLTPGAFVFSAGAPTYTVTISGAGVQLNFQTIAGAQNFSANSPTIIVNNGASMSFVGGTLPNPVPGLLPITYAIGQGGTAGSLIFNGSYDDGANNQTNIALTSGSSLTFASPGSAQLRNVSSDSTSTIHLNGPSEIDLVPSTPTTIAGPILGTGFVDLLQGTVTLTNTSNVIGEVNLEGGSLLIANPANALPLFCTVNTNPGTNVELDGPATCQANFQGFGGLHINTTGGSGTVILFSQASNFTGTTLISAGTLQTPPEALQGGGAISNQATLDIEETTNIIHPLTNAISGTGIVNINAAGGTGTVQLNNGGNSYGGGTNIINGTLRVNPVSAIPAAGGITISAPATLDFETAASGSYGGTISGAGDVIVNPGGGNTIAVTQPATYTGTTTVNSGTYELDNQTTYTSTTTLTNGTSLDFNQTGVTPAQITAQITGTGGVEINGNGGTGIVTFSNANNNYTGGTTVTAGTLRLTNVGAVPNNAGLGIVDNGTVDFQASGTFNGPISGTGGISVEAGAGNTLILAQPMTYTGTTVVNTGTLELDNQGTFASNVTVASGASIDFNQAIATTVTVNGSIGGAGSVFVNDNGGQGTVILTNPANSYSGGTTVSAGTLQINNIAALPGSVGVGVVNNGTLFFNLPTTSTYTGPISGIGNVIVTTGVGNKLVLTQPATYQGTTQVNTGTLELDNQTTFVSKVILAASTAIDFNQTSVSPANITGQITGSGEVLINGNGGTGTVILSNTNSNYTGGTTIVGGTLQTNVHLPGNILDNGILDFEQISGTGIFPGIISGTGSVIINNDESIGTVILSNGANSYAGGTTVANGSLQINNLTGVPGNIAVQVDGTLIFNQTQDGTFNNQFTGQGNVRKIGPNKLTLGVNENGFSGTTTVTQGRLVVNHTLGGDGVVQGNGVLSGNGRITGDLLVTQNATIMPGNNSIGTFHVGGNFTQSGASVYQAQAVILPDFSVQSSLIDINGNATLPNFQAQTVNVAVTGLAQQLAPGQTISSKILHADGGVFGKYAGATSSNPLISAFLTYEPNDIFLNFINTLAVLPVTFNEKQVASQLENISNPTPTEQAILIALTSLPAAEARQVLNEMSGEQYTSTLLVAEFANREFMRRIYDPLRLIINTPYSATKCCCGENELRLDTWAEITGHQVFFTQGFNSHDFRLSGYEVSVGAQMSFNADTTVGAAYSYEMDHLHYDVGGSGKSNANIGGIYALYRPCDYYVLGNVLFGYSHDKIRRDIFINDTLNFTPHSSPKVFQTGYYVEAGKDLYWRFLLVQPFVALEGGHFRFDSISETGGEPLNLNIAKKSISPAYARLGVHLNTRNRPICWSFGLDLAWQYRLTSPGTTIFPEFQDFGESFEIKGAHLSKSFFEADINVAFQVADHWELYAEVNSQTWTSAFSYSVVAGVNTSW